MPKWNQPAKDLAGKRFGKLEAVEYVKGSRWICKCDCGATTVVTTVKLTSGHTQTCGGHSRARPTAIKDFTPSMYSLYQRWTSLRSRCNNPDDHAYENYGGRGVTYDPRWDMFEVFLAEVGIPSNLKHQLDRIDNDKGYFKGNVRWVPQQKNLNNKRTNRSLTHDGRTQTIAEWAEELNIHYRTLNNRINRGWDVQRALTTSSKTGWTGS